MAAKSESRNGSNRLDEALATLIQNQAAFVAQLSESNRQRSEFERQHFQSELETKQRFARIESQMEEIIRVLGEHGRILERMPDAVRNRIGFKGQE